MVKKKVRAEVRTKKHERLRFHLAGTAEKPRLSVFKSNKHVYAQIIDDDAQRTLCAASTMEKDIKANLEKTNDISAAEAVGTAIAKKALDAGITTVVFDRGGYVYQGKVAALADAAREAGLNF